MKLFHGREELISNAVLHRNQADSPRMPDATGRLRSVPVETAQEMAARISSDPTSMWRDVRVIVPTRTKTGEVIPTMGAVMGRRRRRFGPIKF